MPPVVFSLKPLFFLLLFASSAAMADPGFQPSFAPNVMMLKPRTRGFSTFVLRTPLGPGLVAPLSRLSESLLLQRGNAVGLLFRLKVKEPRSFQRELEGKVAVSDEEGDIALYLLRSGLDPDSPGLEAVEFQEGPARLVGYPVLSRRNCGGAISCFFREFWGEVVQMESRGRVWKEGGRYLGDMDALPGSEGSAVLNQEGKVMGMLLKLESTSEGGYAYRSPSFSFVPVSRLLEKAKPTGH